MSIVKYTNFSIKYNLLETHLAHAPMRVTSNGGIWEKKLYKIYEDLLTKNDIVIDVGAYIGTHTLPMAMLCNKVYAFECNEIIFINFFDSKKISSIVNGNKDSKIIYLNPLISNFNYNIKVLN